MEQLKQMKQEMRKHLEQVIIPRIVSFRYLILYKTLLLPLFNRLS